MPTLDWIGKEAVVRHHKAVPYRLLEPVDALSHGEPGSGNLIVEGDNLHALKALLPRYAGKVKCIYIDPPYNTGNEAWVYNDNVNSPEIRKWLDEVVGREGEDLSRHDKWLCMMYPRLVLLRQFLREDGAIFDSKRVVAVPHGSVCAHGRSHAGERRAPDRRGHHRKDAEPKNRRVEHVTRNGVSATWDLLIYPPIRSHARAS